MFVQGSCGSGRVGPREGRRRSVAHGNQVKVGTLTINGTRPAWTVGRAAAVGEVTGVRHTRRDLGFAGSVVSTCEPRPIF